jgi:hypothetical protein
MFPSNDPLADLIGALFLIIAVGAIAAGAWYLREWRALWQPQERVPRTPPRPAPPSEPKHGRTVQSVARSAAAYRTWRRL